jgi:mannosyltransferase OCH1-like enzyme
MKIPNKSLIEQGCHRRLDPLLSYRAWVRRTIPTGISNDVMGAVPRHPFFLLTIELLQHYDRSWVLPYITVMGSTGPLFFSVIWKKYMNMNPSEVDRVRILMPTEYNGRDWSFFTHNKGSSWHGKDARLIFWVCFFLHILYLSLVTRKLTVETKDGPTLAAPHNAGFPCRRHSLCHSLVGIQDFHSHESALQR